ALAAGGQLLGGGCGQVDRVSACRLAIDKAGDRVGGGRSVVAASDAFFPFPDGPQLLIDAGVKCIVHPGGSKRDQETIDLCDQSGVTCLLTGVRHFRH
ncbi:MAG: bifunctional phosphoribosylaminoimidazolecarboxamide formyltransferase/IMP cyclohydrolase, partial [Planctomycetota bacterium]